MQNDALIVERDPYAVHDRFMFISECARLSYWGVTAVAGLMVVSLKLICQLQTSQDKVEPCPPPATAMIGQGAVYAVYVLGAVSMGAVVAAACVAPDPLTTSRRRPHRAV